MTRAAVVALYRMVFGVLALAAIAVQLVDLAAKGSLDLVNYFSYFTIDSNLLGAAMLLVFAARWRGTVSPALELVRGGAVVYLSVTGVVFTVLLSGTDVDTAIPWVNRVVHEVMPIVMVADWLIDPPSIRISVRQSLLWLSFPAVWIGYIMIRGALTARYPYPFLDPAVAGGYGPVLVTCAAILGVMMVFCLVVRLIGNAMSARDRPATAAT